MTCAMEMAWGRSPENYIIDRGHDGRRFSKSTQVRLNAPWMAVGDVRRAA